MRTRLAVSMIMAGALVIGGACTTDKESLPVAPSYAVSPATGVSDQIESLIRQLFPTSGLSVAALTQFQSIKRLVSRGKTSDARAQALSLVDFSFSKYANHQLIGNQSAATHDRVLSLVNLLFQFVGLGAAPIPPDALGPDGAVAVIGPGGGRAVTGTGFAGVVFPQGALSQTVVVTINRDPNQVNPLPTELDQFPLFYDFQTFPLVPHFAQPADVGVCVLDEFIPAGRGPFLRLAHTVPAGEGTTIEILPKVDVPFINCAGAGLGMHGKPATVDLAGLGRSFMRSALWMMLGAPRDLQAEGRRFMMPGGLGGKTSSFSPFGAVDAGATPATHLVFGVQPSHATAGSVIAPPVRVAAVNAVDDTDVTFTGNVTVAIAPGTGTPAAALLGTKTVAAVAGIATFSNLSIDSIGAGYQLVATATGLASSTSATFDITTVTGWAPFQSGTVEALYSVWGANGNDVFAVGGSVPGTILHYDGTSWSAQTNASDSLFGVWGTSGSNVFAVGYAGAIRHYNGTSWSSQSSGTSNWLFGVWGTNGSDVFAVGSAGTILHYNGSTWSAQASGTTEGLRGVWGSSVSDVFAVGSGGTILHYDGTSWTALVSGTSNDLNGVWGASGSDVFAVGGGVIHYDGSTWSFSSCCATAFGVWGTSGSNVFAVGSGGIISHFDGSSWTAETGGTINTLFGVWGASANDVFAVGIGGTVLHRP